MADKRIRNLENTVVSAALQGLLDTLYFAVDDTTFTRAKKMLLKTILTEAVISANTNNYQAMTPKSFYDSVMTTTRKGIGQLATDSDVTAKMGTNLLNAAHQILMQSQWYIDWFVKNGNPGTGAVYKSTSEMEAFSFDVNLYQQFTQYQTVLVSPTLPAAKRLQGVCFQVIANHSSNNTQYTAFNWLMFNGTTRYYWIGGGIGFVLSADGKTLSVVCNEATTGYVSLSAKITAICKQI